jgi:hypothetical protein
MPNRVSIAPNSSNRDANIRRSSSLKKSQPRCYKRLLRSAVPLSLRSGGLRGDLLLVKGLP